MRLSLDLGLKNLTVVGSRCRYSRRRLYVRVGVAAGLLQQVKRINLLFPAEGGPVATGAAAASSGGVTVDRMRLEKIYIQFNFARVFATY